MATLFLFVGCLNRDAPYFQGARGKGLAVFAVDEDSLEIEKRTETDSLDNPTFLSVSSRRHCVYANSEVFAWREGVVSAYRFDPATASLTYLNKQPTLGSITAYNGLTCDDRHLMVANYAMGEGGPDQSVAVLPIKSDDSLSPVVSSAAHTGTGPDAERQERSHAHCIVQMAESPFVLVADLGLDEVMTYRLDPEGKIERIHEIVLPPGTGPRHIVCHPDGDLVVVSGELNSTVHVLRVSRDGSITHLDSARTIPEADGSHNHGADVHLSPDGGFVYASNRGHDSIAVLALDKSSGKLSPVAFTPTQGSTPRNFALTPSGRHLFVANQNGDNIVVFERNPQ